jgi:hypothetical protein
MTRVHLRAPDRSVEIGAPRLRNSRFVSFLIGGPCIVWVCLQGTSWPWAGESEDYVILASRPARKCHFYGGKLDGVLRKRTPTGAFSNFSHSWKGSFEIRFLPLREKWLF